MQGKYTNFRKMVSSGRGEEKDLKKRSTKYDYILVSVNSEGQVFEFMTDIKLYSFYHTFLGVNVL